MRVLFNATIGRHNKLIDSATPRHPSVKTGSERDIPLSRTTIVIRQSIRRQHMKLPAHQFLDDHGIPYRAVSFPPTTEKGAANVAHALDFREAQMVKTLIFETATGTPALIMIAANRSAVSGHLKKALGSRNIKLASPETVKKITSYEIGSIPPFHWQPPGFVSLIDAALMFENELGVGAGVWGQEIIITPPNLVRASQARIVNLSDKTQPVSPDSR